MNFLRDFSQLGQYNLKLNVCPCVNMLLLHLFLTINSMTHNAQMQHVFTVTQLTKSIKTILEGEYRFIRISGEISNLKTPYSGHSYFSLKDASSQIRAVLFKNQKRFLNVNLSDGQQVICFGRISVYEPRGEYQLIIDTVEQFGTGNLQLEFEKLKQRLSGEGLFADEYNLKIPAFPGRVAIISSPTGAALQDFLKIAASRESHVHFQILPVRVQGEEAAPEISRAIRLANNLENIDVIVLCRGGGSLEDLWAFNEEQVARAIFDSTIPIITGVGHEIDFTIADFCADLRCPTPTAAATTLLPDLPIMKAHLGELQRRMTATIHRKIHYLEDILRNNIRLLRDLDKMFENLELRLNLGKTYLFQAVGSVLSDSENQFHRLVQRLESNAPLTKLTIKEQKLKLLFTQLVNNMQNQLKRKEHNLANEAIVLNSVSPLATLARGYSIVTGLTPEGKPKKVLTRAVDSAEGDNLGILLHKGSLECTVTKVNLKH